MVSNIFLHNSLIFPSYFFIFRHISTIFPPYSFILSSCFFIFLHIPSYLQQRAVIGRTFSWMLVIGQNFLWKPVIGQNFPTEACDWLEFSIEGCDWSELKTVTPWGSPPRSVTWALCLRVRGHDSWDGSQYRKGSRASHQIQRTLSTICQAYFGSTISNGGAIVSPTLPLIICRRGQVQNVKCMVQFSVQHTSSRIHRANFVPKISNGKGAWGPVKWTSMSEGMEEF